MKPMWRILILALALQLPAVAWAADVDLLEKKNGELGELLKNAQDTKDDATVLKGIEGFVVSIISVGTEGIIPRDELQTKIELILRRNRIKVDDKILHGHLIIVVEIFKGESASSYSIELKLPGTVYYPQKDRFVKLNVDIWSTGTRRRCGNHLMRNAVNDSLVELTESLCNQYLKQNQDTLSEAKPAPNK